MMRKKIYFLFLCWLTGSLVFATISRATPIIQNGSFEEGLTGWKAEQYDVTGSNGPFVNGGVTTQSNMTLLGQLPTEGNNHALLTASSSISQEIMWQAGDSLNFGWSFVGFDDPDFCNFELLDGMGSVIHTEILAQVDLSLGHYLDLKYQTHNYIFASAGSGIIQFGVYNYGDEDMDALMWVDNVQVVATPVPEAATGLLFCCGIIGFISLPRGKASFRIRY